MNKYEAMIIVKPDLSEDERKVAFGQFSDAIVKLHGTVSAAAVWSEKKKLFFPLRKYHEGVYYLINFTAGPEAIKELRAIYKLNENILRVMVTRVA
jgi:small subunit ribosomal protein S6